MYDICHYDSPLGGITLACDEKGLTGLWFDGQKYFGGGILKGDMKYKYSKENPPVLEQTKKWLSTIAMAMQLGRNWTIICILKMQMIGSSRIMVPPTFLRRMLQSTCAI